MQNSGKTTICVHIISKQWFRAIILCKQKQNFCEAWDRQICGICCPQVEIEKMGVVGTIANCLIWDMPQGQCTL